MNKNSLKWCSKYLKYSWWLIFSNIFHENKFFDIFSSNVYVWSYQGIKYPCPQCDYQFTAQSNLKQHIKAIHEGIKYPCPQCDHQAATSYALTQHVKCIHEIFKIPCNQCDYKAPTFSRLQRPNIKMHEGDKLK